MSSNKLSSSSLGKSVKTTFQDVLYDIAARAAAPYDEYEVACAIYSGLGDDLDYLSVNLKDEIAEGVIYNRFQG